MQLLARPAVVDGDSDPRSGLSSIEAAPLICGKIT
jgi:hypothetical protein